MEIEDNESKASVKKNPFLNDEKTITVTHSSVDSTPLRYNKPKQVIKSLNLAYFKTKKCPKNTSHNHKKCPYFHNHTDRRRPGGFYSSDLCLKLKRNGYCREGFNCRFSHNKVESLYHEDCYKKRFCRIFCEGTTRCDYGKFCAYAHCEEELRIEMIHNYIFDMDFYIFHFKTIFCPFHKCDKSKCVYAHSRDELRRKPHKIEYRERLDEEKNSRLKNKYDFSNNKYCNNMTEFRYHPLNYKMNSCQRVDCDGGLRCWNYHGSSDKRQMDFKVNAELMKYAPKNRILRNTFKFSEANRAKNILKVKQGNQQDAGYPRGVRGKAYDSRDSREEKWLEKKEKSQSSLDKFKDNQSKKRLKKKLRLNPNSLEFSTSLKTPQNLDKQGSQSGNMSLLNDLSSKKDQSSILLADLMNPSSNPQPKQVQKKILIGNPGSNKKESKGHFLQSNQPGNLFNGTNLLNNNFNKAPNISRSVEPKESDKYLSQGNYLNLLKNNSTQLPSNENPKTEDLYQYPGNVGPQQFNPQGQQHAPDGYGTNHAYMNPNIPSQNFSLFSQKRERLNSSDNELSNLKFYAQKNFLDFQVSNSRKNSQNMEQGTHQPRLNQHEGELSNQLYQKNSSFKTPKLLNKMSIGMSHKSNPDYNNKIENFFNDLELKKMASAKGYKEAGYMERDNIGVFNSFGLDRIEFENHGIQEQETEDKSDEKIRDLVSKLIDD